MATFIVGFISDLSAIKDNITLRMLFGQVVACDDLDNYDKNGKAGKKKPLTLIDVEGNELRCTLWGVFG
ncbi:nucleic acid-binding, OB-fold protein [Tanacetum coccineum]